MVLPGNKKFIEGDILPRSGEGSGNRSEAGRRATARTHSASC